MVLMTMVIPAVAVVVPEVWARNHLLAHPEHWLNEIMVVMAAQGTTLLLYSELLMV